MIYGDIKIVDFAKFPLFIFDNAACVPGTSTVEFSGDNFLALELAEARRLEVQELALRFRSVAMAGLMLRMDSQVRSWQWRWQR